MLPNGKKRLSRSFVLPGSLRSGQIARGCRQSNCQLFAVVAKMPLELAEGLVFFIADACDRQAHLVADFGHGPASHPELDDAILAIAEHGRAGGFENFAELQAVALALVQIGRGGGEAVERLVAFGALDALSHHVDGPDELASLWRVFRQHQGHVELALAGLGQQAAANLLGAVVPKARIKPCVPPARGAVALDIANHVRLGSLGGQGRQADHQGDSSRAGLAGSGQQCFGGTGGILGLAGGPVGVVSFMVAVEPSLMLGRTIRAIPTLCNGPQSTELSPRSLHGL